MLRTRLKICALLLSLCALAPVTSTSATAQDLDRSAQTRVVDRDDDGFDMGWVGLLGLVGLAGLAGRNRNHARTATTRDEVVSHR